MPEEAVKKVLWVEDSGPDVEYIQTFINRAKGLPRVDIDFLDAGPSAIALDDILPRVIGLEPGITVITDGLYKNFPKVVEAARANDPQRRVCLVSDQLGEEVMDLAASLNVECFAKFDISNREKFQKFVLGE